ncbi:MAG: Abi family protein [Lentisphaerae bacterium]|jgi:abortive infection bacteriophage resistance protein|nr:Abi family protein [Lentisphaerota bacterium]MBT5605604.1 Abi family protein [Lentisphaerota bacterium]MBT7053880.1 Abi family protein [Lentisphaerota bacterium]MBT7846069.1 Abi family protein [Lentisphaerota bacterium]
MSSAKPATTYGEQLELLKSRGLIVPDEPFALHCLQHHSYYRLSAYRFTITVKGNRDAFLPGTTFQDLWGVYAFDRQLRLLVIEAVKRLEISVRSHWAYVLAHTYGPQAYGDAGNFRNRNYHEGGLRRLDDELGRSDEMFVKHFRNKYRMTRPPIWAAVEVMSFGLLSRFYGNTRRNSDRKAVARIFELSSGNLGSLLEHAVYVRNLCAHHARLWNRRFTVTVELPKSRPERVVSSLNRTEDRRLYNTLVLLAHIMNVVQPGSDWAGRLRELVHAQTLPVTEHMGFPSDWETRPIWQAATQAEAGQ